MSRKKGIVLSYVMMVFDVLSTLLLTPFLIRNFGQTEYGVYKMVISISTYILLLDLGIGNAVIKFTSQYKANQNKSDLENFFGVSQIYFLIISGIAALASVIMIITFPYTFAKGLSPEEIKLGQSLLAIVCLNALVVLSTSVVNNIIIGYGHFGISKGVAIIGTIIRIGLSFVVLILGFGSIGIVILNLIITVFTRLIYVFYVFFSLRLRPRLKNVSFKFVKNILLYSSWILLQMIATQINANIDTILLGILVPSASLIIALYGVGEQIIQYFKSIGASISGVTFPGVSEMLSKPHTKENIVDEMVKIGRLSLMVLGAIFFGFLLFGKHFIILWAGSNYVDSYFVALILMLPYLIIEVFSIGTQALWALNKHKEISIIKLIVVLVNLSLTILLIKWNPLFGAAIGTFISLFLGDIVAYLLLIKIKIKINVRSYLFRLCRGIAPCLFISLLSGVSLINLNYDCSWINLIKSIILFLSIYLIALCAFGFNKEEKKYILKMFKLE